MTKFDWAFSDLFDTKNADSLVISYDIKLLYFVNIPIFKLEKDFELENGGHMQ